MRARLTWPPLHWAIIWTLVAAGGIPAAVLAWPVLGLPSMAIAGAITHDEELGVLVWSYPLPLAAGLGLVQALVLEDQLTKWRGPWQRRGVWLAATVGGAILGMAGAGVILLVASKVAQPQPTMLWALPLAGMVLFTGLGAAQALILRQLGVRIAPWIAANAAAGAVIGLTEAFFSAYSGPYQGLIGEVLQIGFWSAPIVIYGVVTGATLGALLAARPLTPGTSG
jgi:hypothetical protein